jgi:hypothetical protein
MRLVGLLLGALAVCLVGFVFAVYDYTRHGKGTTASSVASTIDAPSPATEPSPTVYPSPPPFEPPAATPEPVAAAQPGGTDGGTGPVALAPQQPPGAAPPAEDAAPAPPAPDSRARHQGGGHSGHGDHGRGG